MEETMEKEKDQTSEGLNQIFEIINAKGDEGELKQIIQNSKESNSKEENTKNA
jgi:hypothetical protein